MTSDSFHPGCSVTPSTPGSTKSRCAGLRRAASAKKVKAAMTALAEAEAEHRLWQMGTEAVVPRATPAGVVL